jgi:hypothetical protein
MGSDNRGSRVASSVRATQIMPLVVLIVSCTCCGGDRSIFVEEHVTTAGTFNGLTIGTMSPQVLSVASTLGATQINPTPCEDFRISLSNVSQLPPLAELEGVRVTNKNSFVDIYFAGNVVTRIVRSPLPAFLTDISIGNDMSVVRAALIATLKSTADASIAPVVNTGSDWGVLILDGISGKQPDIDSHNCWQFEINSVRPAGAFYKLVFANKRLESIKYRRPRINTE